jgi:hypothetical protein
MTGRRPAVQGEETPKNLQENLQEKDITLKKVHSAVDKFWGKEVSFQGSLKKYS